MKMILIPSSLDKDIFYNIDSSMINLEGPSQKVQDHLSRFHRFLDAMIKQHSYSLQKHAAIELFHGDSVIGANQYHYYRQIREPIKKAEQLNELAISSAAKQALTNCQNTAETSFLQSSLAFLSLSQTKENTSPTSEIFIAKQLEKFEQVKRFNYLLYVINFPPRDSLEWTFFVERISFRRGVSKESSYSVLYEAIVSMPKEQVSSGYMNWFSASKPNPFIDKFSQLLTSKLNHFESILIKRLNHLSLKQKGDGENCHLEFRREDSLPQKEYKKYTNLKQITYAYFRKINQNREMNSYFLDNLVCRFLMIKEYNEEEAQIDIKFYLDWQSSMRKKYTLQSFKEYNKLNVYSYIGNDYQGRPILFFRSYGIQADDIKDIDLWVDYNLYVMDILMQDHMEGYVDEFIMLADYEYFGISHFKLSIAQKVAEVSGRLFPHRGHKYFIFGMGSFCYYTYRVIKPFLPRDATEKAELLDTDRQKLKQIVGKYMSVDIIPKYILSQEAGDKKQES